MRARTQELRIAVGAVAIAGLAAAAVPPPAGVASGGSGLTRTFAALASSAVVALAAIPLVRTRGASQRLVWTSVAVLALAIGIGAFALNSAATGACTARYDGRRVVIGTERTPLGQRYAAENPGLSSDELLFDSAGVADRMWTSDSIERCRTRLATTYVIWVPCLVVCLLAVLQSWPTSALSVPARSPGGLPPASAREARTAALRYDVFISYRHGGRDGEFARELLQALEREGYTVAIDERDFPANASFLHEMERCVRESRFTIALVSPRYLGSGHCEEEAILCKVLDMGDRSRRLLPMILEPVELPAWLFGLVGIDCTKADPLVDPLDRLKAVLGTPLSTARA